MLSGDPSNFESDRDIRVMEFYSMALNPDRHYELVDGVIYDVSPANPPHAGIVMYLSSRLTRELAGNYLVRVQDVPKSNLTVRRNPTSRS
jgi:hypothetical protein